MAARSAPVLAGRLWAGSVRVARALLLFGGIGLAGACTALPTTFVLSQPVRNAAYQRYHLVYTPIADDADLDRDLAARFEVGVEDALQAAGLAPTRGAADGTDTLQLRYRAAGLTGGSLAMRAGSAAVNAFLPVSVVPEVGSGDLGVETTFLAPDGTVVGRVLVQAPVRGVFSTESTTMRRIGSETGRYAVELAHTVSTESKAAAAGPIVIDMCPETARASLAPLEALAGTWDMEYEFERPGRDTQRFRAVEVGRWEAGHRVFLQTVEIAASSEPLFRCTTFTWDPFAHRVVVTSIDSVFGVHASTSAVFERKDQTIRGSCLEADKLTESTEVVSEDGRERSSTRNVWSHDRSRLLLAIHTKGHKRAEPDAR